MYKAAGKIKAVKNQLSPFIARPDEPTSLPEVEVVGNAPKNTGGGDSSAADMKIANEAKLQEIDRCIAEKKLRISRDFIDGKTLYDDYNKQLEGLELESLDRKLSIYKVGSEERNKIEQLVLDYKVKMLEKGFEEYSKNQEKERRVDELTKKQKEKHYKELNEALQEFAGKQRSEQEKADELS